MRPRSPINQRPRRGGLKCEFCSRSFRTAGSLRTHQSCVHAAALKGKEKKALSKQVGKAAHTKVVAKPQLKPVKLKPKVLKAKTPEKSIRKETLSKQTESLVVETAKVKWKSKEDMDLQASTKMRKVEFKCPICIKLFPVYFSAMKHIQKHHSNKVSPSKPVVPIRMEFCIFCDSMVSDDGEAHKCESLCDVTGLSQMFVCTGCDQKFQSMRLFDIHISGVHSEGVESMFFPTVEEFNEWKNAMEEHTKSSYLILGKYQYKQIYRCSKATLKEEEDEDSPTYFCPSTLIFQEYNKGIQVHFYKEHYGHPCTKYVLRDKYKTYSITDMLHQAIGYSEITNVRSEENDLYGQFKKLTESIVLEAAKINVETLKTLFGKALEMISVLKNYKADDDDEKPMLSLCSNRTNDLAKALGVLNSPKPGKRSVNTSIEVVPAKRLRNPTLSEEQSPILQKTLLPKTTINNSFSLADSRDEQKILKELGGYNISKVSSPIPKPIIKPVESPSFNDTYKNFVERNLNTTVPVKRNVQAKMRVLDKQNVPDKLNVMDKNVLGKSVPDKQNILGKIVPDKQNVLDKSVPDKQNVLGISVPDKQHVLNKKSVPDKKSVPAKIAAAPKKKIVKTKMGQFKPENSPKKGVQNSTAPSVSPKKSVKKITTPIASPKSVKKITALIVSPKKSVKNSTAPIMSPKKTVQNSTAPIVSPKKSVQNGTARLSRSIIGKSNDIKYEVKEQENDCNILILKI